MNREQTKPLSRMTAEEIEDLEAFVFQPSFRIETTRLEDGRVFFTYVVRFGSVTFGVPVRDFDSPEIWTHEFSEFTAFIEILKISMEDEFRFRPDTKIRIDLEIEIVEEGIKSRSIELAPAHIATGLAVGCGVEGKNLTPDEFLEMVNNRVTEQQLIDRIISKVLGLKNVMAIGLNAKDLEKILRSIGMIE